MPADLRDSNQSALTRTGQFKGTRYHLHLPEPASL